jgi:putative membrane-bound dehydrogenase-like protein
MTKSLAEKIQAQHQIFRQNLVFSTTHTHCAPDIINGLTNIFATPLSEAEQAGGQSYRDELEGQVLQSVNDAIADSQPARIQFGLGLASFAANRRVLKEGRWINFGVQADGPVDHSVPVLQLLGSDGKPRGIIFNYACHCTTIGGDYYRVNGEWAGHATALLETTHPGAVAICTIGCGADANPEPRGAASLAEQHGKTLADEVLRIISQPMTTIHEPVMGHFDYAGLSFDLPTIEELRQRSEDSNVQVRRHAEHWMQMYKEHGRLPATYPVPIQAWQFGKQLTMVFLGGEVVADYALRLKRELPDSRLWITAYANDVLGYIASEKMRREGGYEYDRSGVYYNLPGPWGAGSEDLLIQRIHALLRRNGPQPPLNPEDGLRSMRIPKGHQVQLVASEPQIQDPINLAFGQDGSVWVVEMGDYPLGENGGRIKRLRDRDRDGQFEQTDLFLDGLSFPTGVQPWGDGVIVSAAPEVFFARDTNGDGRADERQVWYSGFGLANPQHRINGFAYGLDHSLLLGSGDNLGMLTSMRTGETVNASGRDVQIWPQSGRIGTVSGRTQYLRCRNDWNDWFGNENSLPMYHYPIDDRYLKRNSAIKFSNNTQQLFDPPTAPPVFPASVTVDRFNDLYTANRFTSACGAMVIRSRSLPELDGDLLVCEPVHNLVHRSRLVEEGSSYRAQRHDSERQSEFFASTDPWSRPVRAVVGPDGMLWIVDMYRSVIEHPEWIPLAWQEQLDLRGGADCGRIYRVSPQGHDMAIRLPNLNTSDLTTLVKNLESGIGTLRDMAQQELLLRREPKTATAVKKLLAESQIPEARVHALWILRELDQLSEDELVRGLKDSHDGVVRNAMQIAEPRLANSSRLVTELTQLVSHPNPRVRLQLALTLGESKDALAGIALAELATRTQEDRWLLRAILTSSRNHTMQLLEHTLSNWQQGSGRVTSLQMQFVADLLATARDAGRDPTELIGRTLARASSDAPWTLPLIIAWADAGLNKDQEKFPMHDEIGKIYARQLETVRDTSANPAARCQSLQLLGRSMGSRQTECEILDSLLEPAEPLEVQVSSLERLSAFRDRTTAERVLARWPRLSLAAKGVAANHFLAVQAWTIVLVEALEAGSVSADDLSPSTRQALRHSGSRSLQVRVDRVLGKPVANQQAVVDEYLKRIGSLNSSFDAQRGAVLYTKHCAACHQPNGEGHSTGPSLANLTDRNLRPLLESILDPNRSVEAKYRGYTLLAKDGRTATGIIAEEAGDSLTLALADGKRQVYSRTEIEDLRGTGMSLMPEGIQKELTPEQMRDLIGHLLGLHREP